MATVPHGDDRGVERNAVWELLTTTERSDAWFERQLSALPETFVSKRQPAAVGGRAAAICARLRREPASRGLII